MRKLLVSVLILLFGIQLSDSQIITTSPSPVYNDYNGVVEIVYDATKGTAGLKDYTGTDGVYAHTGVITSASTSDSDWKHAPSKWGDNSPKYLMTSLGNNLYKLLITPSMASYYGLNTGEVIKKLAFVFRNGLLTKEGKDTGAKDILVSVLNPGINVEFTSPTTNQTLTAGASLNFTISTNIAADIQFTLNDTVKQTVAGGTALNYAYTFASPGDFQVIAKATANGKTVADTLQICVPKTTVDEARPNALIAGVHQQGDSSVVFVLHAPNKLNVYLIGEMNNWTQLNKFQFKRDGEFWWYQLDHIDPNKIYAFQYLVDGNIKITDPYAEMILDPWNDQWINYGMTRNPSLKAYPVGKTESLVSTFRINKTAFNWQYAGYTRAKNDNLVIYEILLRDFTVEKTLDAALTKLDYLQKLGVTAIELMPISEFDGNESWGYNPNHYFAYDKAYGDENAYKRFIDECHKRGMAVILDVVFNHATGLNPMAKLYWNSASNVTAANNPWFNVTAPHPYSVFHDFNHSYAPTREYFKRVVQYWVQEFKVDGYRLDLTKGFTQRVCTEATASNYDQSRIDYLTEYYNAAKSVKNDVIFILEHLCDNSEESVLANKGMMLWRNQNYAYCQSAMGYLSGSDFSGMVTSPRNWVGYAESHDEERNFYKAKAFGSGALTTDSVARIKRVPLNVAFSTLLPGPKMMWEFEELGYDYSINSFGGRMNAKPSAWNWLNLTGRKASYDACSKIISLKKMFPNAFAEGTYSYNLTLSDWESGRRIGLIHSDLSLVVMGNFKSDLAVSVYPNLPKTGLWYNVLTGEKAYYSTTNLPVNLQPGELLILSDREVNFGTDVQTPTLQSKISLYPSVTDGIVNVLTDEPFSFKVFNLQGALLSAGNNEKQIDLTAFPAGIYLIDLKNKDANSTFKVIRK